MDGYKNACSVIADDYCRKFAKIEEKIAREIYGCPYSELDEDERAEVSFEAHDRMDQ